MASSSFMYVCITNNPALEGRGAPLEYMDAASLEVLKKGRALVHEGWEMLASPVYGNFKPNQQPYRTLIFRRNKNAVTGPPDVQSLSLIEGAVRFYENARAIMLPGGLPENIEKDFRYLDFVLLEETFSQYKLLTSPLKHWPEVVDK